MTEHQKIYQNLDVWEIETRVRVRCTKFCTLSSQQSSFFIVTEEWMEIVRVKGQKLKGTNEQTQLCHDHSI